MKMVNNFVQSEKYQFNEAVRSFLPKVAVVPFCQTKGKDYICIVQKGDRIQEGQTIAMAVDSNRKELGAQVHSPIPGVVTEITQCSLPDGCVGQAAKIKLGGSFSYLGKKQDENSWQIMTSEEILNGFNEKGISNTFGESILLAKQIRELNLKSDRFLVVRLFDEDPSRMTDTFIAQNCTDKVVEGAWIIATAMHAEGIVFVSSRQNKVGIRLSDEFNMPYLCVEADTSKYPAGFVQNLLAIIKKNIRNSKNPQAKVFKNISHMSLFIDPETAVSVYDGIVNNTPVVERYVHVTGSCLNAAGMFKVRIGSSIGSLAEQCGGFKKSPSKIIINGLITGNAISTLDIPVTKQVKSVTFLQDKELSDQHLSQCIRCGQCRSVCPEGIYPDLLFRHRIGGKPVGDDLLKTAVLCSGCCLCNSVCPSRLPLCQTIELLKGTEASTGKGE